MRWLLAAAVATLALALAAPTVAAPKKPKPPPPPPPDTAADCTFTAQADVPDYLVLATLILGVDCATVKQDHRHRHRVHEGRGFPSPDPLQHDHVLEHEHLHLQDRPLLVRQPSVASPGDQRYCASGFGLVGGRTLGPAGACGNDPRL